MEPAAMEALLPCRMLCWGIGRSQCRWVRDAVSECVEKG